MTADTVKLYAEYNSHANKEMNKLISNLQQAEWEKEFNGYYKSIKALCSHLYIGDFAWLKRFGFLRTFNYLNDPAFNNNYSWGSSPFITIDEYLKMRIELDSIINSFAGELQQDDFGKNIQYKNWKGENQNRNFGGLLIHVFNHQTHHRGMISLYLEFLGKENDFANLLVLV